MDAVANHEASRSRCSFRCGGWCVGPDRLLCNQSRSKHLEPGRLALHVRATFNFFFVHSHWRTGHTLHTFGGVALSFTVVGCFLSGIFFVWKGIQSALHSHVLWCGSQSCTIFTVVLRIVLRLESTPRFARGGWRALSDVSALVCTPAGEECVFSSVGGCFYLLFIFITNFLGKLLFQLKRERGELFVFFCFACVYEAHFFLVFFLAACLDTGVHLPVRMLRDSILSHTPCARPSLPSALMREVCFCSSFVFFFFLWFFCALCVFF